MSGLVEARALLLEKCLMTQQEIRLYRMNFMQHHHALVCPRCRKPMTCTRDMLDHVEATDGAVPDAYC